MIEVIKSAAKKMLIDFESTKKIIHNPTKGRAREFFIMEEFLKPYLPSRYSIGSGIIIDAKNNQSRQQDLVIYDQFNSPLLMDFDSDKVFFPESVFVSIEVKSTLNTKELSDMVKKSASVWSLLKTPPPETYFSPSLQVPSQHLPIFCLGICFESTMALKDIPTKIRKNQIGVENGHALSCVCVLKDKNGKSGLILNVSREDLKIKRIIPDASTRLAVVEFDDEGDALLYTYLMLMDHLRISGAIIPGPDLKYYAEASGLGKRTFIIDKDEMKGASVESNGSIINMDEAEEFRKLGGKFSVEKNATDEDILNLFHLQTRMPGGEGMIDPMAKVYVDGLLFDFPDPILIYQAIIRYRDNNSLPEDDELLQQYITLVRTTLTLGKKLLIGTKK